MASTGRLQEEAYLPRASSPPRIIDRKELFRARPSRSPRSAGRRHRIPSARRRLANALDWNPLWAGAVAACGLAGAWYSADYVCAVHICARHRFWASIPLMCPLAVRRSCEKGLSTDLERGKLADDDQ